MRAIVIVIICIINSQCIFCQRVGIGNLDPQSSLDVKGDIIFRVDTLHLQNGANDNIDITTSKSMNYLITGPNTTFELGGFNGGRNGRIITLYNSSPAAFYVKNYSAGTSPINQINTGVGADFIMNSYSTITFQYLAIDSLWHVVSRYGEVGSFWTSNGNDIYNTNTENVGIGILTPSEKLDVAGHINVAGEIKNNGIGGQQGEVLTSLGNGSMQWMQAQNNEGNAGYGSWGDCSINNISHYFPVGDENGESYDYFGKSVSISGDYAIVGASEDNTNGLIDNGSVSFYKRMPNSEVWEIQGTIQNNPLPASNDLFGYSVCISGNYAIVGSPFDDEGGFTDNGTASIYKLNANTGIWEIDGSKLTKPNSMNNDYFGFSVGISGDYAIVGTLIDGESGYTDNGCAYIYKRNGVTGVWEIQGSKLTNPSAVDGDYFGIAVSISGDYAIIGARGDSESGYFSNGSASIFKRNEMTHEWQPEGNKLLNIFPSNVDKFGSSVHINGMYAIVGAPEDDEAFSNSGSATVFKRNENTGIWEAFGSKLTNLLPEVNDYFGNAVSISTDFVMIGSYNDNESGISNSGSVSIFRRLGNGWELLQKFSKPYGAQDNQFGNAVALDILNNRFVVGAQGINNNKGLAFFGKIK